MDDDLNTADAISVIFELIKDVNTKILSVNDVFADKEYLCEISELFKNLTFVLGIVQKDKKVNKNVRFFQ